jgi:hypothetical protein
MSLSEHRCSASAAEDAGGRKCVGRHSTAVSRSREMQSCVCRCEGKSARKQEQDERRDDRHCCDRSRHAQLHCRVTRRSRVAGVPAGSRVCALRVPNSAFPRPLGARGKVRFEPMRFLGFSAFRVCRRQTEILTALTESQEYTFGGWVVSHEWIVPLK